MPRLLTSRHAFRLFLGTVNLSIAVGLQLATITATRAGIDHSVRRRVGIPHGDGQRHEKDSNKGNQTRNRFRKHRSSSKEKEKDVSLATNRKREMKAGLLRQIFPRSQTHHGKVPTFFSAGRQCMKSEWSPPDRLSKEIAFATRSRMKLVRPKFESIRQANCW